MNNKEIIKSNNNTLRKVKNFPSATSIWNNSIYSFNQNYLKNIPAVDNIVNKLIKSFFSINALANNPKGKKSKLVQRRYKRLSLNKILVSKSEIKHNNDKVFITVYLFNKKKKSLILKLKNLKQAFKPLSLENTSNGLNNINLNSDLGNNLNTNNLYNTLYKEFDGQGPLNSDTRTSDSNNVLGARTPNLSGSNNMDSNLYKTLSYKLKLLKEKSNISITSDENLFNNITLNKYASVNAISTNHNYTEHVSKASFGYNSYIISYLNNSVSNIMNNNKFFDKPAQNIDINSKIGETKLETNTNSKGQNAVSFLNSVRYYKNLNTVTKYNIHMFINSFVSNTKQNDNRVDTYKETSTINKNIDLRNYFKFINKYKLYNNIGPITEFTKDNITKHNYLSDHNIKPNYSVFKLKSMNKLFTLYNNINLGVSLPNSMYSNKIMLNTYKLLRKSYAILSTNLGTNITNNEELNSNYGSDSSLNPYNISYMSRKSQSSKSLKPNSYVIKGSSNKSYIGLKNSMRNIILINKLNRIDRFFDKYKKAFLLNMQPNSSNTDSIDRIISNYKVNFINELMEKELLYVYYLKLLSYNDIVFKNWFLYSLKNLISKIYNKKVIFNLINLKYIHLNSDILAQAVNIRLRNFKKNRVVKVLKKVIKLVPISKVNIYACDENSAIYKYVNNYHNKFRNLKLDIFKELGLETGILTSNDVTKNTGPRRNGALRKLNHLQANTINFIKYKSVFGVRLEAAGRLTKRSTASRSIFKYRYNGTLRNNAIINNNISSVIVKDNRISNLQFTQVSSKTRNGSFGLKGWINNN